MAKKKIDYEAMLKSVQSGYQAFASEPYVWKEVDPSSKGEKKVQPGLCRSCMQGDCTTLVTLEDGVVVRTEGRPDAPPNYGSLCPKGNSEIMAMYNPYRVKTPMIRTNPEKGLDIDPMWKEVTWDEAYDFAVESLNKLKAEDPRGLIICEGWGQRDTILREVFGKAFGTPNETGSHGALCTVHYPSGLVHAGYPVAIVDLEYCNYHITMGRSIGPNFGIVPGQRKFANAIERGMKLVCVDPRSSYEAAKGDWVPIKPGTDLAFLLAMVHVMMYEIQTYDEWFIKNRTNSPYLVKADGEYLRDSENNKPLMWDSEEGKAKTFDAEFKDIAFEGSYTVDGTEYKTSFTVVKDRMKEYTPEWAEKITTVPPATVRRVCQEFVDHARIGSTIEIDGFTFPYRPVSLNVERNVTNRRGGTYADLTGKLVNMLVGALEVPGGCISCGYRGPIMGPSEDGTVIPDYEAVPREWTFPPESATLKEFYPHQHTAPHLALRSILYPEENKLQYKVDGWFSVGGNPIRQNAQPDKYVEGWRKLSCTIAFALHMDETAIMSDVLFPESSALERIRVAPFYLQHQAIDNEVCGLKMIQYREPAPTLFNTRHVDTVFLELADRLGILTGEGGLNDHLNNTIDLVDKTDGLNLNGEWKLDINKKYTLEEIYDRQIRGWIYNKEGWTLETLKEKGYVEFWRPRKEFYLYYYWPDNKTRHPFYLMGMKEVGDTLRENLKKHNIPFPGIKDPEYILDLYDPVCHWVDTSELDAPEEYDLWAINWKTPYYGNDGNNVTGNPWLAEIYSKDPWEANVLLNPVAAERKGLKDGDQIIVESRYGKLDGRVNVSELFHPDTAGIAGSYGLGTIQGNPLNRVGPCFNYLLSIDPHTYDGLSAGQDTAPAVKVYKKEVE
ncbi:molybdopterin-dependent oxidoreductase [Thermodesulfobacteriota bacterium]